MCHSIGLLYIFAILSRTYDSVSEKQFQDAGDHPSLDIRWSSRPISHYKDINRRGLSNVLSKTENI